MSLELSARISCTPLLVLCAELPQGIAGFLQHRPHEAASRASAGEM